MKSNKENDKECANITDGKTQKSLNIQMRLEINVFDNSFTMQHEIKCQLGEADHS